MTPERWRQVKSLLAEVMEEPPHNREQLLADRCAGDPDLRLEVCSLLEHAEEPVAASSIATTIGMPEMPAAFHLNGGRTRLAIGPYRLEKLLGEGGMGSVHLAVREVDGYPMRVALKIMRVAALSDYSLRRFRMERQILARLSHPNITRLLDGGVTEEGLPFLVTEYIEGLPLDRYCERMKPSVPERLQVFLDVCSALSFAHRNLIVHGDLKPANILVTPDGRAKLVDFGIARLLDTDGASSGATTTFALTPGWASPEQLRGEPPSVLSDLYSAGRVFYELLAGQSSHRLSGIPPQKYLDILAETPPPPSSVVPEEDIDKDLDNIACKAIEFEPDQRYQSADQFSEDIRCFLESRPISARKTTWRYRAAKFTRRHQRAVVLAATVSIALLSLLTFAIWQARAAREHYATAARQAEAVRKLANSLIFELDDAVAEMPGTTQLRARLMNDAVNYLDRVAQRSAGDFSLQEELGLGYLKIGDVLGRPGSANLGKTSAALDSYKKAEKILEQVAYRQGAGADEKFHLSVLYSRVSALDKVIGNFRSALDYDRKALTIREALLAASPNDRELQRAVGQALTSLGATYSQFGDWKNTIETRRRALAVYEKLAATDRKNVEDRRGLVLARTRLASILSHERQYAPAFAQLRTAVSESKTLVDENPRNAQIGISYGSTLVTLGRTLDESGDTAGALRQYESARAIFEARALGDAADVRARSLLATTEVAIGRLLTKSDRPREALPYIEKGLRERLALSEQDKMNSGALGEVAFAYSALGDAYRKLKKDAAARSAYENAKRVLDDLVRDGKANAVDDEILTHVAAELKRLPK